MLKLCQQVPCARSEALVLVEVVPLCRMEGVEGLAAKLAAEEVRRFGPPSEQDMADALDADGSVRCMAVMSCDEALFLAEGVADVVL